MRSTEECLVLCHRILQSQPNEQNVNYRDRVLVSASILFSPFSFWAWPNRSQHIFDGRTPQQPIYKHVKAISTKTVFLI